MNLAQTIFALFFAIFWGTVANAWPRWKPFHWPIALKQRRVFARLAAALALLNLTPLLVAGVGLWILRGYAETKPSSFLGYVALTVAAVLPAFAMFGLSRIWVGVMESWPSTFYFTRTELDREGYPATKDEEIEPSQETLRLDRSHDLGLPDMIVGVGYVVLSLIISFAIAPKVGSPDPSDGSRPRAVDDDSSPWPGRRRRAV